MPVHKLACPACQAVLKSPEPIPPGKKVRCPKCQQTFVTPKAGAKEAAVESVIPATVKLPPRVPARDPHEDKTLELGTLPRRKPPAADDTEALPLPARSAEPPTGENGDHALAPGRQPGKRKNLGVIMAAVGGGSFVGMILFMILMTVFAVSAVSNTFPKGFPGNPKMNVNFNPGFPPQGDNAQEMEDLQNKLKAQVDAALAKGGPKDNHASEAPAGKISRATYEQVQVGGRFDDVEKLIGPGERVATTAVPKLSNAAEEKTLAKAFKDARPNLIYKWEGEGRLVIAIATADTGDITIFKGYFWQEKGKQKGVFQMDRSKAP